MDPMIDPASDPMQQPVEQPAAQASSVAVETVPQTERPEIDHETDLIARFQKEIKLPSWLTKEFARMEDERKYVHTDAFANDDVWKSGVNFLLRSIYAKLSQIFPSDPACQVKAERMINTGLVPPQIQMMLMQERQMKQAFAETSEALANMLFKEANGISVFQGAAQDALTVGIAWVKVTWMEDLARDPLGVQVVSDQQDQVAKLRQLATEFANNAWDQSDGRYQELLDLGDYMIQTAGAMQGGNDPRSERFAGLAGAPMGQPVQPYLIPEPERWMGVRITPVLPENLRLDWARVTQPELYWTGRHVTERTWMHRDEIARRWDLTEAEKDQLGAPTKDHRHNEKAAMSGGATSDVDDPSETGLEDETRGDEVAVYERWDNENRRVYIWAQGLKRFLHSEVPQVVSRRFFPYILVYYNRVTGRFLPLSDVSITRKLQDEINQKMTDLKEHQRAQYPRYLAQKGILDDEEAAKLESADPHQVIWIKGSPDDIAKKIVPILGTKVDPSVYDVGYLIKFMETQMGLPTQAMGLTGQTKLATDIQVANDHALAQSNRHAVMLTEAIRQAHEMILDYAVAAMPTDQVKRLLGPTAMWPVFDREQIFRGMKVEISASGSDKATRRQDAEVWQAGAVALQNLLQVKMMAAQSGYDFNVEQVAGEILRGLGLRMPVQDIMRPLQQAMMADPGAAAMLGDPAAGQGGGMPPAATGPAPVTAIPAGAVA